MRPSFPPPPCCSCLIPWLIALRESPVARETTEIPPHPIAIASLAATSRRARSFSSPLTSSNLRLITSSLLMPHSLSHLSSSCYLYFLTSPKSCRLRGEELFLSNIPCLHIVSCLLSVFNVLCLTDRD